MRYSKLLIPTTREVPAEAEIPSHQLMIRAGFLRKIASGTYAYLPLGLRVIQKITQIVREEMNASGAQEVDLPFIQPMELWDETGTGRRKDYGETLGWFVDRHGRENVLAPTAEEVMTHLVAMEIKSYKQLPINLYQIKTKYRDEFRPRFGVLRSREFLMKDGYSFHTDPESLDVTYREMYDAYCRIFTRCGVPYVIVEAETGEMGGSGSHQFTVPCENGEDVIVYTADGEYAANIEKADVDAAQTDLEAEPTGELELVETPDCKSIEDVTGFFKKSLGTKLKPQNMLKTLVCHARYGDGGEDAPTWIVAVVRGDHELNPEKLFQVAKGLLPSLEHLDLAEEAEAAEAGFPVGFVGPHVEVDCLTLIDASAATGGFWVVGGNRKDTHAKHFCWKRDFLANASPERYRVADIRNAIEGDTHDGKELLFRRGIEVGQVFKLGSKYSKSLGACFLDETGASHPCLMGCYGIGINRIFASAIEAAHDENGCILPAAIAPFDVEVIPLNNDKEDVRQAAESIYNALEAAGLDVLLDDREARPGVKFKDADLIGIPVRIVIGERALNDGHVELKKRTDAEPTLVAVAEAAGEAKALVESLKNAK